MQIVVSTSDIKKRILTMNQAEESDIIVTKLDKPRFVIINYEKYMAMQKCLDEYEELKQREFLEKSSKMSSDSSKRVQSQLF